MTGSWSRFKGTMEGESKTAFRKTQHECQFFTDG